MVLDQSTESKESELCKDLLSIVHVFSCRANGARRYKKKANPEEEKLPVENRIARCCEHVLTKTMNGIVYGRECGKVLVEDEEKCPKHQDEEEEKFEKYWPYCCSSIIKKRGTGVSEERSRKGLECGEFCKEGEMFCAAHKKTATKVENPIMRCIKVRARPSVKIRKILEQWFGGGRKTFNLVHEQLPEHKFKGRLGSTQKNDLEAIYKKKLVTKCPDFLKTVPKNIRSKAVEEYFTGVVNAYNMYDRKMGWEAIKKEKYGKDYIPTTVKRPETKFKTKRRQQCIDLPSKNTSFIEIRKRTFPTALYPNVRPNIALRVYPKYLPGPIVLDRRAHRNKTLRKIISNGIQYDYKLLKTKSGKYYVCLPYAAQVKQNTSHKQVACDPGVRDFQTSYSPQGEVMEFGHNANQLIRQYHSTIRHLKYQYFHGSLKGHARTRKLRLLLQDKLKNMITDLHYKTAHTLCSTYNTVIVPHFGVRQMIQGEDISACTKNENAYTITQHIQKKADIQG